MTKEQLTKRLTALIGIVLSKKYTRMEVVKIVQNIIDDLED